MNFQQLTQSLSAKAEDNQPVALALSPEITLHVYPKSVTRVGEEVLFVARRGRGEKFLFVASKPSSNSLAHRFQGDSMATEQVAIRQCPLTHENATVVRDLFDFARPKLLGIDSSFGFGDRLGLANPAHLRAVAGTRFKVVLAQQSIRELQRTQRTPDEVMDTATWAVLQEGYKEGFGADADHLKTFEDIDRMVNAGFTFFTIDPSAYVANEADALSAQELEARAQTLPWERLQISFADFIACYQDKTFRVANYFTLQPDREAIRRALVKYGGVIAHTADMYHYLKERYPQHPAEFEVSVDETESVTSPFEHFLVANELKRLGVELVSLAPRFVGEFEKGIDFKGDLERFKREYLKHIQIAEHLGPYKLSIHSGSDKFSVYEAIGALGKGSVHVKTAGTSYLEALRTIAKVQPDLFREILDFARAHYETEKATYHVSAQLSNVPAASACSDAQLLELFNQNDARQVLHVTFGKVLTATNESGEYLFRDRILACLREHEDVHYDYLVRHFRRHLRPFVVQNADD